ncbi:MAG: transposase [Lewinellaceae bacterium]|nr:transposase [Lewinellaceae bacterium]
MATLEAYRDRKSRQNRYFSESFRKKKVREIERNQTTVREVSKEYDVSTTSVYKWLYKYSKLYQRDLKQVVEPMSDTRKIKALQEKIKELEQLVGQKQIMLEFYEKMMDLAEQEYGIRLKKKSVVQHLIWYWENRSQHGWTMNAVYGATGMTKQNFHQRLDRYLIRQDEQAQMVKVMHQVRQDHPAMGAESMYRLLSPQTMGRDRF